MALAQQEGRVLYTQDDDFLKLAAAGAPHAGIVYARQGTTEIGAVMRGLELLWTVAEAEEMVGRVEYLQTYKK